VVRRPDTTHTLVQTGNRLLGPLQLVAAGVLENHSLLQDVFRLEIAHTDRLLTAIDVLALDDGMLAVAGRNADLDLRVFSRECGKGLGQEGTDSIMLVPTLRLPVLVVHSQHAARAATVIAVVEVEALALEDEGTDAILWLS